MFGTTQWIARMMAQMPTHTGCSFNFCRRDRKYQAVTMIARTVRTSSVRVYSRKGTNIPRNLEFKRQLV